jgi:hypothetical protein
MKDPMQGSLDEQLASLPRDIPPTRDLWPAIARGAARTPRRARPLMYAAAASVTAACLASALTWAILHGRAAQPAAPAPAVAARAPNFDDVRTPRYVAARDSLERTFHERLALLDPATRAKIESSLALIRKAHEDIRQALAAAPENPVLEQLWESTWQDEFDLYDDVVRGTQPTMTRT